MYLEERFECLKCGAHGKYPGVISVGSKCPACNSWWIVPTLVFAYPRPPLTPLERRKRFKLIQGELESNVKKKD